MRLTRKKKRSIVGLFLLIYDFISIWTEEERDKFCLDVDGMRKETLHDKEKRYIYILMRYTHAYTQQKAHQEEKKKK